MMKKKILLTFLIITMLAIVGCSGDDAPIESTNVFLGGTEGVTAKFEPFSVTEDGIYSLFDTETFPIEITLQNKGEYEIQKDEVSIKLLGPSQDEFAGVTTWETKNKGVVDKKSDLVPNGGEETITFATDAKFKAYLTGNGLQISNTVTKQQLLYQKYV